MNARRHIWFLAAALTALLAGSCAKIQGPDEDGEWNTLKGDVPVAFSSSLSAPATKATLPPSTHFGVFAFYQPGTIGGAAGAWNSTRKPNFMYNEDVLYSGGSTYTYSPIKYWSNNEENTITFWAYCPYTANLDFFVANSNNTYTNSSAGIPDIQFTADGYTDILYSDIITNQTRASNSGVVDISFNHALALIDVFVQKIDDPDDDYIVTLNSVRFNGLYMTGILKSSDWSWYNYSGSRQSILVWEEDPLDDSDDAIAELENGVSHSIGSVMPMPQSLSNDLSRLQVVFTLSSASLQSDRTTTQNVFLRDVFTTAPYQWNRNAHYSLTIRISPDRPIEFTVSWSDWGADHNYHLSS
jgi:hypothetical protein